MIPKQSVKFAVAAYLEGAVSAFYVTVLSWIRPWWMW